MRIFFLNKLFNTILIPKNYCPKAKEILGWESKKNLEEMCKDGWNWQLKK